MKEKIYGAKIILLMFAIVITFALTISCSKPVNYYVNQVDNFLDRGYPKPERILGTLVSDIDHEIVDGTAVIEGRDKQSSSRWWINVKCDYWASCFMRCDGSKQQCRKLAEDANFTVNSISPF